MGGNQMGCIYEILNLKNNKFYIGSTINFQKRKSEHISKLNSKTHYNRKLQNSWNKHGEENFKFIVLEEVQDEKIREVEQKYIDELKPYYNLAKEVTGALRTIRCQLCGEEFDTYGPAKYCEECKFEESREFFLNRSTYRWRYSDYETKNVDCWDTDDFLAAYWDDAMEK
jgi:predicted GIY-YIG superfamily endonuclease